MHVTFFSGTQVTWKKKKTTGSLQTRELNNDPVTTHLSHCSIGFYRSLNRCISWLSSLDLFQNITIDFDGALKGREGIRIQQIQLLSTLNKHLKVFYFHIPPIGCDFIEFLSRSERDVT